MVLYVDGAQNTVVQPRGVAFISISTGERLIHFVPTKDPPACENSDIKTISEDTPRNIAVEDLSFGGAPCSLSVSYQ